jgi:hypothetical protein
MTQRDDDISIEEQAAAAEARRIGGQAGDEHIDPARRPLYEAGEGEAEGFEWAEHDLVDHAEYTFGEGIPRPDQMGEEEERDPAVYGEPDEEDVTEVVFDPEEGPDAPSAGPGVTHDT